MVYSNAMLHTQTFRVKTSRAIDYGMHKTGFPCQYTAFSLWIKGMSVAKTLNHEVF